MGKLMSNRTTQSQSMSSQTDLDSQTLLTDAVFGAFYLA